MAKKGSSEFFEAFRRTPHAEQAEPAKKSGTSSRRSSRRRTSSHQPGQITLSLNCETTIIAAFVLVCIIVLSHVWGYRRGLAKTTAPLRSREQQAVQGNSSEGLRKLTTDNAGAMEPPFVTVRVIGAIRLEGTREVRDYLRERSYDAFVINTPGENGFAVGVGRFKSQRDAQARELKMELARTKYVAHQFQPYFYNVKNKRSIVE